MIEYYFGQRRTKLLHSMPDHSVALVVSGSLSARNRDSDFPFRVDSDFWYLTGFDEPDAILVLDKREGKDTISHLFLHSKNKAAEIWTGRRLGVDAATEDLGIDQSYDIASFEDQLTHILKNKKALFSVYAQDHFSQKIQNVLATQSVSRNAESYPQQWHDLSCILHEQRLLKKAEEIDLMRQASMISSLGHIQMMRATQVGTYEYQLAATMTYESMMQGAQHQAYNPIVASGANACILHYNDNNTQLQKNDLTLIDAGCEFAYYASDITRTFPVNGYFLSWQKELYLLVLQAQKAAIAACLPGNSYESVHQAALNILCDGLIGLQLLSESKEQIIEEKLYQRYFMHGTSHWLGLDVHDVGAYTIDGQSRVLEPGMVLTVEPGLYIAEDDAYAPKEWLGTGIRIEDDIHITESAPEILTIGAPKEIDDITAIIGNPTGRR